MASKIIFITGGARSGKSSFAVEEASALGGRKAFIATAEALDDEMRERVERHRRERGEDWDTFEEPLRITDLLSRIKERYNVVVLDCLTVWLANLMAEEGRGKAEDCGRAVDEFVDSLNSLAGCALFIVSNEVGMGIVPDNQVARRFRDLAGSLNQRVAGIADGVYLTVSGIPVRIK